MSWAAALASLTLVAGNDPAAAPAPHVRAVPSAQAALQDLLARQPAVIAFGEFHQTAATKHIPSALHRFTADLWPALAPGAAELVVETWISQGNCGKQESAAVGEVAKTTERPAETESEIVTLLRRAKEGGVRPQILELTCADYTSLRPGGQLDYERLLKMTSDKLQARIEAGLGRAETHPAPGRRAVVVYGGALHNDLFPIPELAPFTFGRAIKARTKGRYLEVDLYVPEYIAGDARIRAQPWYRDYRRLARPGRTVLVERAPDSFIVIFPGTPGPPPAQRARR